MNSWPQLFAEAPLRALLIIPTHAPLRLLRVGARRRLLRIHRRDYRFVRRLRGARGVRLAAALTNLRSRLAASARALRRPVECPKRQQIDGTRVVFLSPTRRRIVRRVALVPILLCAISGVPFAMTIAWTTQRRQERRGATSGAPFAEGIASTRGAATASGGAPTATVRRTRTRRGDWTAQTATSANKAM